MNADQIELFSLESALMNAFAAFLTLMAVAQFLGFFFPAVLRPINDRFDSFVEWIHRSCEVLPWLFFAAFIAIVTPIYDIFVDGAWLNRITEGDTKPMTMLEVWRTMVNEESDANSKRDLVHSIQWVTALGMFYLYSICWLRFATWAQGKSTFPNERLTRGVFFGGFAALIKFASDVVSAMGQNAQFVLL